MIIDNPAWNAWTDAIRTRAERALPGLVQAVASKWSDAGRGQWRCCSPLRQEKTPSFYVYENGSWFDFGVHEGGDTIEFVMRYHRMSFREALDWLAEHFNLPPWETQRATNGAALVDPAVLHELWTKDAERREVRQIMSALVHLAHDCLPDKAREHLRRHYGLFDWTIDMEKIGYVPSGFWELAKERFAGAYSDEQLLSSGFFVRTAAGPRAAQAMRILFPYWFEGLCVYTIGREYHGGATRGDAVGTDDWDRGKYKKHLTHSEKFPFVSPTISNEWFWGEDSVRRARGGSLFIIEGITDAMVVAQLGRNVISPVTTSFSNKDTDKAIRLGRLVHEIVILNDADVLPDGTQPGRRGALRMGAKLISAGVRVRIGRLPRPAGASKIDINEIVSNILCQP